MFLMFFLIFVLLFTVFENVVLASIFLLLVIIGLWIYQVISKKKLLSKKIIVVIVGAFVLAGLVFGLKEWRYYGAEVFTKKSSAFGTSFQIKEEQKNEQNKNQKKIVWTGSINDISAQGKYIFEYNNNKYLLYSKKEFAIGDVVRLMGNLDSGPKPDRRNDVHGKYRKISSSTFAVPLFSGGFDYPKWLKMKGWKGTIYETSSMRMDFGRNFLAPEGGAGVGIIKKMKKSIQEKTIEVYGENKISGLILGMLIGDKLQIPESEYKNFVDSGLVHLIAVSGGNILMIVVFLQFVLFRLPFYVRTAVILCTIIVYGGICGMDSSVFRAVIMGGMSMLALFWGREVNIRRLLSISAILMLIINPYFLVYDVGFLLSYSALIGLIYFQSITTKCGNIESTNKIPAASLDGKITPEGGDCVSQDLKSSPTSWSPSFLPQGTFSSSGIHLEIKEEQIKSSTLKGSPSLKSSTTTWSPSFEIKEEQKEEQKKEEKKQHWFLKGLQSIYKNYISPSIGASLGIFPVLIFFMGKMNFMGIIGNLFVLPIVPFVMIYGFISSYLFTYLHWSWLLWIEKILVVYIYKVAELLTKYGVFVVVSGLWMKYLFLLLFVGLFLWWRYKSSEIKDAS